jgi:hypothetical protein
MFYEAVGDLLGRVGEVIADRYVANDGDEDRQRELRQIGRLASRVSEIWPDLFATLAAERRILSGVLEAGAEVLRDHGRTIVVPTARDDDPLSEYGAVQTALGEVVAALHDAHAPWAQRALRTIRAGIAEAAAAQGRLVDRALTV